MALISRAIPNLINGVSQQPPTMRHTSQGELQENGYSTVERGLGKRPPFEHVASLGLANIDIEYVASGATWTSQEAYTYKVQDHVTLVLNGTMYVIGGITPGGVYSSQVWKTTDGTNWTQATGSAPWVGRGGHAGWVYDDKLWIAGGWYNSGPAAMLNDVWWSEDGATWFQATAAADWSIRAEMGCCVFGGYMWLMGGTSSLIGVVEPMYLGFGTIYNDIWYSADGITWLMAVDNTDDFSKWARRHSSQTLSFNGYMWVLGGKTAGGYANDVWYSADGIIWAQATGGAAWQGRYEHAAVTYNNKMWVLGGRRVQGGYITEGQQFRDVWNSDDGVTWNDITNSAEWGYRDEHTATAWNNSIMVIGGYTDPIPGAFPNDGVRSAAYEAFKDVVNTTPDHVTDGGVVDFNMSPIATKDAYVHFINRDDNEQYVVLIADGTIGVWDLQTGVARPMTAVGGLDYLIAGTPRESFAMHTVADVTFIVNKTIDTAMTASLSPGTITGTVQAFANLPGSPSTGQIYLIAGTPGTDLDNYYVKYDGSAWVEWIKPGIEYHLDRTTMPHKLTRLADGSFQFAEIAYNDRLVGDTVSNPDPSFIGGAIKDIFFYRNRLGFVSDEDVILSRAGDLYNFFAQSVTAVIDSDPIDVGVSSSKVSILNYAIPFNKSLLLFANQTQFQLSGGDNLTPKTVRVDPTTEFEASIKCRPVGVGPDVYFPTPAGNYTRIREYFVQPDSLVNDAADVTAHVASYVPKNLFRLAGGSNENLLLALTLEERNAMYVYKFYWGGKDEKVQSAWSKWIFPEGDRILGTDIFNNVIYSLTLRGDDLYIDKINVETRLTTGALGFRLYLDRLSTMAGLYDSDTDLTTWTLPYPQEGVTIVSSVDGSQVDVEVVDDSTVTLEGDYSSTAMFVGVPYTFRYRFSTQYYKDQQQTSILNDHIQLRTMTLALEETGRFYAEVTPDRRSTYTTPFYGVQQGLPTPSLTVPSILDAGTFRFPILSRNTTVTIDLVNPYYTPSWFQSAEWEGMFTLRHRR